MSKEMYVVRRLCLRSSKHLSETTLSTSSIPTLRRTADNRTLSTNMPAIKHRRSRGEPVVLLPVFLVFEVVVPIDPVRVRSETCAEGVVCLLPPRHGGNGTAL